MVKRQTDTKAGKGKTMATNYSLRNNAHRAGMEARINRELGTPQATYDETKTNEHGGAVFCIGHHYIERGGAYQSWKLNKIKSESGADTTVLHARTGRELVSMVHAYLDGYHAARERS